MGVRDLIATLAANVRARWQERAVLHREQYISESSREWLQRGPVDSDRAARLVAAKARVRSVE